MRPQITSAMLWIGLGVIAAFGCDKPKGATITAKAVVASIPAVIRTENETDFSFKQRMQLAQDQANKFIGGIITGEGKIVRIEPSGQSATILIQLEGEGEHLISGTPLVMTGLDRYKKNDAVSFSGKATIINVVKGGTDLVLSEMAISPLRN